MGDRRSIEDLAAAIADRTDVDWVAAESSAGSEWDRGVVRRLRRIGAIAEAHRSLPIQWGHLSLLERIGEGAFGEVYLAWDTKLEREVALKLLRAAESSEGAASSAAVEEGRVLARVRHPNVVAVYGADRIDGRVGIWMDFIRGRTLEQVLAEQGPFGAQEATLIGLDLCEALAAVHGSGFVHRDVKAQNVMREDGGRIVLMDFGTGRERLGAMETANGVAGTPLYMAPEVLAGGPASVVSDVYSLGVLLYHLVTGGFPIGAQTLAEVREAHRIGARTRLRDARPDLPDAFVRVVDRATAVQPRGRFDTAGAMEAALADARGREPRTGRASWLPWSVAAAVVIAIGATVVAWRSWQASDAETGITRFVEPVDDLLVPNGDIPPFAISPDGTRIAFVTLEAESYALRTRALSDATPTILLRSEHHIQAPTFSPDGRSVAFFMRTDSDLYPRLWSIGLDGGAAIGLTGGVRFANSIAWGQDGVIVYSGGPLGNLWRTTATGMAPQQLTAFKGGDTGRASRPQIMPDGSVLFTSRLRAGPPSAVLLLNDGTLKLILEDAARARFVPPGYLIFTRGQSVMGMRFDLGRLEVAGPGVPLTSPRGEWFDVSATGSLVSAGVAAPPAREPRLAWIDRDVRAETPVALQARRYFSPSLKLAPNGRLLAVAISRDDGESIDFSPRGTWVGDVERGTWSLLAGDGTQPLAWSPDSRYLTFRNAKGGLSRRAVDSSDVEQELADPALAANRGEWTRDGSSLLLPERLLRWPSSMAVGREAPRVDQTPIPRLQTRLPYGFTASFSPDGQWVAYHSIESGRIEVYASRFGTVGPVLRISVDGGQDPRWRGKEIFYREPGTPGRLLSVRVDARGPSLSVGNPQIVVDAFGDDPIDAFDVSPDGRRFLMVRAPAPNRVQMDVVLNWIREVRQKLD